jgi:hypothetical protein
MGKTFTSGARKILVACLLLVATGCDEDGVAWLPDSSGFIYTSKDGTQVLQFDVKRRAKRIVLSHMGKTSWPGLSADGKRVAVADCTVTSTEGSSVEKYSLTITIYSLEGEQLKRSKPFTITETNSFITEKSSVRRINVYLDWSGPANKLIVMGRRIHIYDTVQDKFIQGSQSVIPWPLAAGSPVIPSKKGFLAVKVSGEDRELVYYDWDGWETSFEGFESFEEIGDALGSIWKDENTLVLEGTKATLTLDMLKKTATFSDVVRPSLPSPDKLVWRSPIGEKSELCLYSVVDGDTSKDRLEIQIPSERKRRSVFTTGEYKVGGIDFFPSPDGSLVAISCTKANNVSEESIIVVDAMGNIVAKVSRP